MAEILQKSSNIGADKIGMELGAKRFDYWVHRFGFGSPTGIDLPGENEGIVRRYWQYSGSSMGNLPIGQGESVTPIQMATAYSAIANGGILRPPHIVKSIGGKPTPTPGGHRIISSASASELRDMLRGVFADGGTASGAGIKGYDMAGKTGTANVVVGNTYSSTEYVASFIGFVPDRSPEAAGRRDRRPAAGRDLRWRGRRAGVPEDRRVGGAVLRDLAPLTSPPRGELRPAARPAAW